MYFLLMVLFIALILIGLLFLKIRSDNKKQEEINENVLNPVSNSLPGISSNKAKIFIDAFIHGEARVYGEGTIVRSIPSRTPPRPQPRMSSSRTSQSNSMSQNLSQNSFRSNDEDDYLRRMRDQTLLNEIIETSYHNSCCDPSSNCSDSGSYDCSSSDSGSCSCSD